VGMQRQVDLSPPADTSPYASPYTDSGPYATPYASAYGRRPVGYRCVHETFSLKECPAVRSGHQDLVTLLGFEDIVLRAVARGNGL
jgi:hypothetical protein